MNIRGFRGKDKGESNIGWFRRIRLKESPDIVLIQESKCGIVDDKWIETIWGSSNFKFVQKPKVGKSGGMLMIWDPDVFLVEEAVEQQNILAIKGKWIGRNNVTVVVNVYGPHKEGDKKQMWEILEKLINSSNVEWVLGGDFNEVRSEEERQNCLFNERWAKMFNSFINDNNLIEIPLLGKRFTRICDNGKKFSKLDRFLVNDKFLQTWDEVSVTALDRNTSDHCPIIIRNGSEDFGPKPFKFFDIWLESEEAEKVITEAWSKEVFGLRADCNFRDKLKNVKDALKSWSKFKYGTIDKEIESLKMQTVALEEKADSGLLTEAEREQWLHCRVGWMKREKEKSEMLK
ncbi:uncharacterized protein [Rutidosis leptorrhynchoides]|uniref:uncharacterized protein n=1 Tax=Rutidosis leptorrhynchoides TaxID=125765 RepID=UPI003A99BCC7